MLFTFCLFLNFVDYVTCQREDGKQTLLFFQVFTLKLLALKSLKIF